MAFLEFIKPRLLPSHQFALGSLALFACLACDPMMGSGTEKNGSTGERCGDSDPVRPPPVVPNFQKKLSVELPKVDYQLYDHLLEASARNESSTKLVALMDQVCVAERTKNHEIFHQKVPRIKNLNSKIKKYAYKLEIIQKEFAQFLKEASQEPCLLHLTEDRIIKTNLVPNDTYVSSLSHLDSVHAWSAWDYLFDSTLGIDTPVVIAIVDSGVDIEHLDLTSQLWTNSNEIPANGIDDDLNGYIDDVNGYNMASDLADPNPELWPSPDTGGEGHGTHVAGLAAATGNNSRGVTGMLWQFGRIMAINVFGASSSASIADIVNGINYAVANGAQVINLSLGAAGSIPALEAALTDAVNEGVTVVVAAGNAADEMTDSHFYSPGSYGATIDGVITVGSLDVFSNKISRFSNYSSYYVEILAPGSHSQDGGLLSTLPNNAYGYAQGTSMAAPVVAGAAGLVIGQLAKKGRPRDPATVERVLLDSSPQDLSLTGKSKNSKKFDLLSISQTLSNNCY